MTENPCVLVVSEDPEFIHLVNETCAGVGSRCVGCLGPAHTTCVLESEDVCPLAAEASIAVVDVPGSGSFTAHWKTIAAGAYAGELARRHPGTLVLLCGPRAEGTFGPTATSCARHAITPCRSFAARSRSRSGRRPRATV